MSEEKVTVADLPTQKLVEALFHASLVRLGNGKYSYCLTQCETDQVYRSPASFDGPQQAVKAMGEKILARLLDGWSIPSPVQLVDDIRNYSSKKFMKRFKLEGNDEK